MNLQALSADHSRMKLCLIFLGGAGLLSAQPNGSSRLTIPQGTQREISLHIPTQGTETRSTFWKAMRRSKSASFFQMAGKRRRVMQSNWCLLGNHTGGGRKA